MQASKTVKRVAAGAAALGTIASVWWFALKPRLGRRRAEKG
jgi:hypothetical protein